MGTHFVSQAETSGVPVSFSATAVRETTGPTAGHTGPPFVWHGRQQLQVDTGAALPGYSLLSRRLPKHLAAT